MYNKELEIKKGKSTYTLQFRCEGNTIEQLMQSYISANGFTFTEKKVNNIFVQEIKC